MLQAPSVVLGCYPPPILTYCKLLVFSNLSLSLLLIQFSIGGVFLLAIRFFTSLIVLMHLGLHLLACWVLCYDHLKGTQGGSALWLYYMLFSCALLSCHFLYYLDACILLCPPQIVLTSFRLTFFPVIWIAGSIEWFFLNSFRNQQENC